MISTDTQSSQTLFDTAQTILVGGVDSPVRAFKSVGGTPVFMKEGHGAHLISEDNKTYIDYVLSWGPMILGHADPVVTKSVIAQAQKGTSFGTSSALEAELGFLVQRFFPSIEKIRFVSSGTEAVMSAIRTARGFTNRDTIVKFNGCYHGHPDSMLVSAGSGALTFGQPDSAGVPKDFAKHTVVFEYNDTEAVKNYFKTNGNEVAAVILEPVCGNMGVVLPNPGFLETLRELCTNHGTVLIFDEVMTGFRVHEGGAQALYGIKPDLTCLGKVIGGGLPAAAFGGQKEIMDQLAPVGPVYQAGTLSGNPLAMAAGIATLQQLTAQQAFQTAKNQTDKLVSGLNDRIKTFNWPIQVQNCGTMFTIFFSKGSLTQLDEIKTCDKRAFNRFYHEMLESGVYMAPSQFEANFMSNKHTDTDIEQTLNNIEKALQKIESL